VLKDQNEITAKILKKKKTLQLFALEYMIHHCHINISNLLVVQDKYKCSRNKNSMISKNFFISREGKKTLACPGSISHH